MGARAADDRCARRPSLRSAVCHADVTDVNVVATPQRGRAAVARRPHRLRRHAAHLARGDVAVAAVSLDRPRPRRRPRRSPPTCCAATTRCSRSPRTRSPRCGRWWSRGRRPTWRAASTRRRLEPDDEYVQGSVDDDWRIWRAVRAVPWRAAHAVLAEAVGHRGPRRCPSPPPPRRRRWWRRPSGVPSVDQSVTADTVDPEELEPRRQGVRRQLVDGWGVGTLRRGPARAECGDGGVSTGVEVFAPAGHRRSSAPAQGAPRGPTSPRASIGHRGARRHLASGGRAGSPRRPSADSVSAGDRLGAVARRQLPHVRASRAAGGRPRPPPAAAWRPAPPAGATPLPTRRPGGRRADPRPAREGTGDDADAAAAPP